MNTKIKLTFGVAFILLAAIVWRVTTGNATSDARRQTAVIVQVERPRRMNIAYKLNYNADVVPIQQANIYSKINGNIERLYADIGDRVSGGRLLALIDTLELSQLAQQASATYENARSNYQRTRELAEQNLIARQELDNAEAAMKVSRANFEAASTRLSYAHITAPFSGYITKRLLDAGVNVKSNDIALFTLMNSDIMKIFINVLEKDIPLITRGKRGIVTVDAYPGKEFFGTVTKLSEAVDLSTRTMAAEIDVANADHLLKPGMFASVTVLVKEHPNALTVPLQAVTKDEKGKSVFTVSGTTARRKEIDTGGEEDSRVEILSGLADADTIITTGAQFVKDGTQVTIQQ
jgi:membrane fusion protein (multidrug efflux system)